VKVISLDCESNGLGGQVFAAAATLTDDGREVGRWTARCPIDGAVDPWVAANVLPALRGMPESQPCYDGLLYGWESRWRRWKGLHPDAVMIVHVAWPVEARFLRDAHADDLFAGPYPIIDVAPLLLAAGHDPRSVDAYLDAHGLAKPDGSPHHPLYDARAAEAAFRHLMRRLGPVER
jgi:hypothetical protein